MADKMRRTVYGWKDERAMLARAKHSPATIAARAKFWRSIHMVAAFFGLLILLSAVAWMLAAVL